MGYLLSSLGNLPIENDVNLYIFVGGGGFQGGRAEVLERNFVTIARQIGPNAVIAKGFQENVWSVELAKKYFGEHWETMLQSGPGVLITDAHPERLRDDSLRLFIPLKDADESFGGLEEFFQALSNFALHRDPSFLDRFRSGDEYRDKALSAKTLPQHALGIGVNIDVFKRHFQSLRRSFPMAEPTILAAIATAVAALKDAPSAIQAIKQFGLDLGLIERYRGQTEPEIAGGSALDVITQGMKKELLELSQQFVLRKETWDQRECEEHRRRVAAKAADLLNSGKPVLEDDLGPDQFNRLQAVFDSTRRA